jgi:hypothetical protein
MYNLFCESYTHNFVSKNINNDLLIQLMKKKNTCVVFSQ